jgi:hypothetical protein
LTDELLTRIQEVLAYIPETGVFIYKKDRTNDVKAGEIAGTINKTHGYRVICVFGKRYLAHRLAWLMTYGIWPKIDLDHINGDSLDNRINNLRLATEGQNLANSRIAKNNRSGVKGVCWRRDIGKWSAQIRKDGKLKHIGLFATIDEAATAYEEKAKELFGEFARTSMREVPIKEMD